MSWREWTPPRWLVMYGHTWAAGWGIPTGWPPEQADISPNDLATYLNTDLDAALARLLADEGSA